MEERFTGFGVRRLAGRVPEGGARDHSVVAGGIIRLPIEYPPSSRICAPATCAEAEEGRNNVIPARSCVTPTRFQFAMQGITCFCLAVISSPF